VCTNGAKDFIQVTCKLPHQLSRHHQPNGGHTMRKSNTQDFIQMTCKLAHLEVGLRRWVGGWKAGEGGGGLGGARGGVASGIRNTSRQTDSRDIAWV